MPVRQQADPMLSIVCAGSLNYALSANIHLRAPSASPHIAFAASPWKQQQWLRMMADDKETGDVDRDLEATLELLEEATYSACMKMKVKDLKAELELRKVNTEGVMEKEELARLLADARASGKADPALVDEFNKQALEKDLAGESVTPDVDADAIKDAVASDGGLPGGMSPEALAALMANPEMMTLLRNPKMQEVMKKVMEEGPGAAESMMNDPELRDMLEKVQQFTNK